VADEFERIAEIRRRLRAGPAPRLRVDIGDDAAVLEAFSGAVVLSVDSAVEGVHFDLRWLSFADVGYRAFAAALSDLAAMGARPRAALVALIAPADFEDAALYAIADGIAEAQEAFGAQVAGGNLARGSELSLSTTVIGEVDGAALTRAGARVGERLYVGGRLGAAALGRELLAAGSEATSPERAAAVAHWRRPKARLEQGRALAGVASCCIDISDGLLQDLSHLAEASGLGFAVELEALPLAAGLAREAAALGLDPLELALSGGEDYELLFCGPEGLPFDWARPIGRVEVEPGLRLVDAGGRLRAPPARRGYRHFAAD